MQARYSTEVKQREPPRPTVNDLDISPALVADRQPAPCQ